MSGALVPYTFLTSGDLGAGSPENPHRWFDLMAPEHL